MSHNYIKVTFSRIDGTQPEETIPAHTLDDLDISHVVNLIAENGDLDMARCYYDNVSEPRIGICENSDYRLLIEEVPYNTLIEVTGMNSNAVQSYCGRTSRVVSCRDGVAVIGMLPGFENDSFGVQYLQDRLASGLFASTVLSNAA